MRTDDVRKVRSGDIEEFTDGFHGMRDVRDDIVGIQGFAVRSNGGRSRNVYAAPSGRFDVRGAAEPRTVIQSFALRSCLVRYRLRRRCRSGGMELGESRHSGAVQNAVDTGSGGALPPRYADFVEPAVAHGVEDGIDFQDGIDVVPAADEMLRAKLVFIHNLRDRIVETVDLRVERPFGRKRVERSFSKRGKDEFRGSRKFEFRFSERRFPNGLGFERIPRENERKIPLPPSSNE